MKPSVVRSMLAAGISRAEIGRRHGISRQAVTIFIRKYLPDLHGSGMAAKLAAGHARRDAQDRERQKREAFRAVLRMARASGWTWKALAEVLCEPRWKRLQALIRAR